MLVGRGLERLDRSRSHHILSQEEVKSELLPQPSLCLSGGGRKDYIMARAGNHRDDQEPVSSPLATAAPDCSLPQRQLTLSHPSLHLSPPGKAQTLDISS